jgi:hypothetical protein
MADLGDILDEFGEGTVLLLLDFALSWQLVPHEPTDAHSIARRTRMVLKAMGSAMTSK